MLAPDEHVLLLARRKAAEVAARLADDIPDFDGIVIGGDSMFELDGAVLGKPHTAENAIARWQAMRGRTGVLHSGHAVVRLAPGVAPREVHAVAAASVTFADDVTDAEIDVYVASGEPLLVAGAFTVDSLGGAFITASRAIRRRSWGCRCRRCDVWCAKSGWNGPRCGTRPTPR